MIELSVHLRVLLLVCLVSSAAMADNPEGRKEIYVSDARARERLRESAQFVSQAQRFSLEASSSYDYLTDDGELIESGSSRTMTVRRPDRVRVDLTRRDGVQIQLAANGESITFMRLLDGAYARLDAPENLDGVVDLLIAKFGSHPPLADLLYSDLWGILKLRIDSASHLGESMIEGVMTDHLLFRNPDVDWEIWIEQGEKPLPRRLVVRYKNAPRSPTFRATIHRWNLKPKVRDKLFELEPAKGAKAVPFSELEPKER